MIYYLTLENIQNYNILNEIYFNDKENYYWSDDWSSQFYIELAKAGFISVTNKQDNEYLLLPEIQFEYAILYFEDLHISKKVKKLLNQNNYSLSINKNPKEIIQKIQTFHQESWLCKSYIDLLEELASNTYDNFELLCVELKDTNTKELISGEIGYKIGSVYTSLTGFSSKDKKYNNWGNLQLVLLAKYLEENNYKYWNLGHPYMDYKIKLGVKVLKRIKFLEKWFLDTQD